MGARKKGLEQSSVQEQNLLRRMIQNMERDLERAKQDFFLGDNVVRENKNIIIPKKTLKNRSSGKKNYSPTKVKSPNFFNEHFLQSFEEYKFW